MPVAGRDFAYPRSLAMLSGAARGLQPALDGFGRDPDRQGAPRPVRAPTLPRLAAPMAGKDSMIAGNPGFHLRRWLRLAGLLAGLSLGGCVVNPVPTPGPEGAGVGTTADNPGKTAQDAVGAKDVPSLPTTAVDTTSSMDSGSFDAAPLPLDATAALDAGPLEQ